MTSEFQHYFLTPEAKKDPLYKPPPYVDGSKILIDGVLETYKGAGSIKPVTSPIFDTETGSRVEIGKIPMMKPADALSALDAAVKAYDSGRGAWPTSSVETKISSMENFVAGLKQKRNEIAHILMWEICKPQPDAEKEIDRTIAYIQDTLKECKKLVNNESTFHSDSGVFAQIRRAPLGVVLCMGPFNYPFNESYTTLIPAILMGNTVVLKLPRVGVLCHVPTFELFQSCFPKGVVNIISGSGHETVPPIMKASKVDVFAFIGSSTAADALQKDHPKPHRLRICLGLEAKNPAIVLPDADLEVATNECILGSLSFNGQRCTALKIIFVHKDIEAKFVQMFAAKVDALQMGLPWKKDVKITPLPEEGKPGYLSELIADALKHGAKVVNTKLGGRVDRTICAPTVLYPVNDSMRIYNEEQFGPVVPIASFEKVEEIYEYLARSQYGQQASVFSINATAVASLIDVLVNQVSRVNLNSQCQRGPDSFPFTARKDSAYGTLSVYDALRVFSVRSLVAAKQEPTNQKLVNEIIRERKSTFLRMDYLF